MMTGLRTDKQKAIFLISAIAGVVSFLGLLLLAGYGIVAALLIGALVAFLVTILLWIGWMDDAEPVASTSEAVDTQSVGGASPRADRVAPQSVAPEAPAEAVTPEAAAPVQSEIVQAEVVQAEIVQAEIAEEAPQVLSAARAGQADDLKRIKGVGPKLEETLNALGFWHFDQIAALTPAQVAWVDSRLRFKGRIERDDWIGQAKALMDGA